MRGRFVNQRLAACPMETRGCVAVWEGAELTFWTVPRRARRDQEHMREQVCGPARRRDPSPAHSTRAPGGAAPRASLALSVSGLTLGLVGRF